MLFANVSCFLFESYQTSKLSPLKVDGNEKLGGGRKEPVSQLLSGIVGIEDYFKLERVLSP